jgi:hypothetical protein
MRSRSLEAYCFEEGEQPGDFYRAEEEFGTYRTAPD